MKAIVRFKYLGFVVTKLLSLCFENWLFTVMFQVIAVLGIKIEEDASICWLILVVYGYCQVIMSYWLEF